MEAPRGRDAAGGSMRKHDSAVSQIWPEAQKDGTQCIWSSTSLMAVQVPIHRNASISDKHIVLSIP